MGKASAAYMGYTQVMIMIYNGKKVGHNGPEETTDIKQGVG